MPAVPPSRRARRHKARRSLLMENSGMRSLLPLCLLGLLPVLALADDKEKSAGVQPIKVVTLDRKDPVTYEKDIEPILVKKCFFCHSGNVKEAKFDLGSHETLMKG